MYQKRDRSNRPPAFGAVRSREPARPGYERILKAINAGSLGIVTIDDVSRLARNSQAALFFRKKTRRPRSKP